MKYVAECFAFRPYYEEYIVTGAIYKLGRLSMDWIEKGESEPGHLEISSDDDIFYKGTFGYPRIEDHMQVEMTLFKSGDGELLFIGQWWNRIDSLSADWAIRLKSDKLKNTN